MTRSAPGLAVIYARISRDAEGNKIGVQRQEKDCRALAKTLGLTVSRVYTDNDIGASNRTGNKPRPAYLEMLQDARDGLIGTILAYSNSRLTRRPLEWVELISLAESGKIQIKTVVSGSHDLTTADGRAVALTVAAWDAAEAERISERQTAAFHHRALQGKPKLQRQRPFGWEADGVTIKEEEASLIRSAVQEVIQGATVTHIARKWEAQEIRTAAGGEKWEQSVVRRILVGWRTAGVRTYKREPLFDKHGDPVMGIWEPIISLEERSQALLALEQHARVKKRQGKWILSSFLRCGECAKPLYGMLPSGTRTRAAYGCKNGHLSISAGLLEEHVLAETLTHVYKLDAQQDREEQEQPSSPEVEPEQAKRVEAISEKIEELMTAYKSGKLPAAIAFTEVDNLYTEREELQALMNAAKTKLPRRLPALAASGNLEEDIALYQTALRRHTAKPEPGQRSREVFEDQPDVSLETIEEINAMLRLVIESVVVQKAQAGLKPKDRVKILWQI